MSTAQDSSRQRAKLVTSACAYLQRQYNAQVLLSRLKKYRAVLVLLKLRQARKARGLQVGLEQDVSVKESYIRYMEQYGIPEDGHFDELKLALILTQDKRNL